MGYIVQFMTCKDRAAAMNPPPDQEYEKFATYADRLLLNLDIGVDMPGGLADGEHWNEIAVLYRETETTAAIRVSSVFLLCPCEITVDKKVHKSQLIVPQQGLVVPKR